MERSHWDYFNKDTNMTFKHWWDVFSKVAEINKITIDKEDPYKYVEYFKEGLRPDAALLEVIEPTA